MAVWAETVPENQLRVFRHKPSRLRQGVSRGVGFWAPRLALPFYDTRETQEAMMRHDQVSQLAPSPTERDGG